MDTLASHVIYAPDAAERIRVELVHRIELAMQVRGADGCLKSWL